MKNSIDYLEQVKIKFDLKNDTELAVKLRITKSAICLYRNGQRIMSEDVCLKIAIALGLANPLAILKAAGVEREKRGRGERLWKYFSANTKWKNTP